MLKAKIKWVSKENGGRQYLPTNDKYGPQIKITKPLIETNKVKNIQWSLLVNIKETINANETIAEVRYLAIEAPDNLYKGVEFELYEGNNLVANGIII